ncbi:MAG: FKBP-type peptidyl-prolyl cis-trans isomerase [Bacteroidales bacterium]|nr:FKBP-type peptidyl-prolyl cis-trans isomerase [Bacteroidales bacterium]
MKYLYRILAAVAFAAIVCACAKAVTESNEDLQRRVREAWIRVYYKDAITPTKSGIYVLEHQMGSGSRVTDSCYVFAYTAIKSLGGSYYSVASPDLCKRMGTYSDTIHYAPEVLMTDNYSNYDCVEELLKMTSVGSRIVALVPPELTLTTLPKEYQSSYYQSANTQAYNDNVIYEIDVINVVKDIYEYEKSLLSEYAETHYPGLDSISEGFYFKKLEEKADADTIAYGSTGDVRYIGRLMDDFVFDTNIQDTAKKYRLYNSDNEYKALEVTVNNPEETSASSDVIAGFEKAVRMMRKGEKAVAFFWSPLGYGTTGSGKNIKAFMPLCFYLELEEDDE